MLIRVSSPLTFFSPHRAAKISFNHVTYLSCCGSTYTNRSFRIWTDTFPVVSGMGFYLLFHTMPEYLACHKEEVRMVVIANCQNLIQGGCDLCKMTDHRLVGRRYRALLHSWNVIFQLIKAVFLCIIFVFDPSLYDKKLRISERLSHSFSVWLHLIIQYKFLSLEKICKPC